MLAAQPSGKPCLHQLSMEGGSGWIWAREYLIVVQVKMPWHTHAIYLYHSRSLSTLVMLWEWLDRTRLGITIEAM